MDTPPHSTLSRRQSDRDADDDDDDDGNDEELEPWCRRSFRWCSPLPIRQEEGAALSFMVLGAWAGKEK